MQSQGEASPHVPDPLEKLRGNWASAPRLTALFCLCLGGMLAAWLPMIWGTDGLHDSSGRLLGADFAAFYAAGKAALAGETIAPYRLDWFAAHLKSVFGPNMITLAWSYPPTVYLIAAPLALLPYSVALLVWLSATYLALIAVARAILGPAARHPLFWLAVIAYPGLFGNGVQGQGAFLTAALFGGALHFLDRKPVLSALLFALLAWKPQFGVLIPLALIAARRWTVIGYTAGFVAALCALTTALLGVDVWFAFLKGLEDTSAIVLERGAAGFYIMHSIFGALRHHGLGLAPAYIAQLMVLVTAAAMIWRVWESGADQRVKNAALVAGSALAVPYFIDYDLVVLAPAIAFAVSHGIERGFKPWLQTALALAFIVPPLARYSTFFLGLPLGFFAAGLLFTIILPGKLKQSQVKLGLDPVSVDASGRKRYF